MNLHAKTILADHPFLHKGISGEGKHFEAQYKQVHFRRSKHHEYNVVRWDDSSANIVV